jgi:hypothetical protein
MDIGDMAEVAQAQLVARRRFLTAAYKKGVVECILPTVLGLRHMMRMKRHRLLSRVISYLRVLMTNFKNELDEVSL